MVCSIKRYENANPFSDLHQVMNSLFQDYAPESGAYPALDLKGTSDELVVSVDLPGVKPEDVDITVDGGVLKVEGERKAEERDENDAYFHQERGAGKFRRTVRLPYEVENAKVSARYDNGVLQITLPRLEASKPRQITIET